MCQSYLKSRHAPVPVNKSKAEIRSWCQSFSRKLGCCPGRWEARVWRVWVRQRCVNRGEKGSETWDLAGFMTPSVSKDFPESSTLFHGKEKEG